MNKINAYIVDLFSDKILQVKNKESLESYHMPYILNSNGKIKVLVEDAKIMFDTTDYSTDDEKQIRVLYDVQEKIYKVYDAPFVMYSGECY